MLQHLITEDCFRRVTREGICSYLGIKLSSHKKAVLVEKLKKELTNDIGVMKFLNHFSHELALHPCDAEKILQCTRTERVRWEKEGRFEIEWKDSFYVAGENRAVSMFNYPNIIRITSETMDKWRDEHVKKVALSRKNSVVKREKTKKERDCVRGEVALLVNGKIKEWVKDSNSFKTAIVLESAMWAMWGSRWAKENNLKARRAKSKKMDYKNNEKKWYVKKNEAMSLLRKHGKLSVYIPDDPDKMDIYLCEDHLQEARDFGYQPWEYFTEEVKKCKGCDVSVDKHYYSLYFLEIQFPEIEDKFSFHLPYPIGVKFWPTHNKLDKVDHRENEGWSNFRFGRALYDNEKIAFSEKMVEKKLNDCLSRLKNIETKEGLKC